MEKRIITFKDYEYIISMKSFFKDEFKSDSRNYLIPIDHIIWFRKNIFPKIRDSCSYVCPLSVPCKGHELLNYINMLWEAMVYADEEKYVYIDTFILKIWFLKMVNYTVGTPPPLKQNV